MIAAVLDSHYYQVGRAIDSLLAMTLDQQNHPVPAPVMTGNDILIGRSKAPQSNVRVRVRVRDFAEALARLMEQNITWKHVRTSLRQFLNELQQWLAQ